MVLYVSQRSFHLFKYSFSVHDIFCMYINFVIHRHGSLGMHDVVCVSLILGCFTG